jgi:two-component system NarL family response regulator
MRILIVDDHILFREGLSGLLSRQSDMQVVGEASSVHEAIEKFRALKPDIILMDFNLSDGTGLDATRVILQESPETNIIFLTVHDDDERLFAAVRLGAKGYLIKNLPVAKLLSALRGIKNGEAPISRHMMSKILTEFSKSNPCDQEGPSPLAVLTGREMEVISELATNATNREIADRLFISENTVRNHMHNILDKLNLSGRREAVALARQYGLGEETPKRSEK